VADCIRADRIDILVDLALHTAKNRLLVFARKPAPVQATMLGMPGTTGLTAIDYRLTDPYLDPPGTTDTAYTEESIRLPHCYWCYQPPDESPPVGALPAAKNGFITFGCLNQFAKVSRPTLELWANLLQALQSSRLIILARRGSHRDRVRQQFEDAGIAHGRLAFRSPSPRFQYLRSYQELDLSLDPFPYNGHTSTLDSLWMGVPVITLAGRTAVGRGGVSILSNLGVSQLIATTPEHYVETALCWATDLDRLAEFRAQSRDRMRASALMDGEKFAADVGAAFRQMWTSWCRQ
jgi:predicted O-linked N-acetylglucosamine transferase (SPINDLY family)